MSSDTGYLVDTNVLLWAMFDKEKLSQTAQKALLDDKVPAYYSPVSLWEISIKYAIGKLNLLGMKPDDFLRRMDKSFFLCKNVDIDAAATLYQLPLYHRDPFDRLLIQEAISAGLTLLSADKSMQAYVAEGLRLIN
ncbi:MAG: type II toxin-antitoxin system VapC family toxin [Actinomycetes bacterium]|jgi:PIN domain nuclease of toxin-antitoxin system|nr:type II toxin-antitoxin system VapC family toxin [Actinomycetes bacterium]